MKQKCEVFFWSVYLNLKLYKVHRLKCKRNSQLLNNYFQTQSDIPFKMKRLKEIPLTVFVFLLSRGPNPSLGPETDPDRERETDPGPNPETGPGRGTDQDPEDESGPGQETETAGATTEGATIGNQRCFLLACHHFSG